MREALPSHRRGSCPSLAGPRQSREQGEGPAGHAPLSPPIGDVEPLPVTITDSGEGVFSSCFGCETRGGCNRRILSPCRHSPEWNGEATFVMEDVHEKAPPRRRRCCLLAGLLQLIPTSGRKMREASAYSCGIIADLQVTSVRRDRPVPGIGGRSAAIPPR